MSHYNPANDPSVINGTQEAYGLKVGDQVEYTNPHGMTFGPHKVVGFVQEPDPNFLPDNTVYIDSDSPWYPVKPSSLRKMDGSDGRSHNREEATKQSDNPKYPKRGGDCEYTEECMLGTDGWCDRPIGDKCEIQKMDEAKAKEGGDLNG